MLNVWICTIHKETFKERCTCRITGLCVTRPLPRAVGAMATKDSSSPASTRSSSDGSWSALRVCVCWALALGLEVGDGVEAWALGMWSAVVMEGAAGSKL